MHDVEYIIRTTVNAVRSATGRTIANNVENSVVRQVLAVLKQVEDNQKHKTENDIKQAILENAVKSDKKSSKKVKVHPAIHVEDLGESAIDHVDYTKSVKKAEKKSKWNKRSKDNYKDKEQDSE